MRLIGVFFGKELREGWRRYRFLVIGLVFLILGLESPLVAKLTPELLKSALPIAVSVPTPTSLDSWQQYYKGVTQIGIFLLAALFSASVSEEVSRGTLVTLIIRGRRSFWPSTCSPC
ncbi:hypothetical protein [Lacticaseibacillus daqingensis]|uniref:hypothetical protein n=1 Tax=Lacticaseibacillus daqingensis TaxID=2486014 RepID=UPI000F77EFFC|nr:hypothetical protein [Lacticaseibacillus daqingensis]